MQFAWHRFRERLWKHLFCKSVEQSRVSHIHWTSKCLWTTTWSWRVYRTREATDQHSKSSNPRIFWVSYADAKTRLSRITFQPAGGDDADLLGIGAWVHEFGTAIALCHRFCRPMQCRLEEVQQGSRLSDSSRHLDNENSAPMRRWLEQPPQEETWNSVGYYEKRAKRNRVIGQRRLRRRRVPM